MLETSQMDDAADEAEGIKRQIEELVCRYYELVHAPKGFVPGETQINYSGRVFDTHEMTNLVNSSLDFWLTAGPYATRFEREMRRYFKCRDFVLVNSGSSANLLMVATLCSQALADALGDEDPAPLLPGDEVITPAVTFPTTLAPIVQNRLIPVFVDCEIGTYNVDPALIEPAIGPRTKAIFVPHTVGNPCDMGVIMDVAKRHNLWLLEDGCDALGATFDGRLCGTFGAMSSLSFFPAHHMTMGEGGGVAVNNLRLKTALRSLRDWGRDCWCDPGKNDTCGKRFDTQLGDLPFGYDHKYTYSNIGYNLKVTDMQAAIGLAQLDKVGGFIKRRRQNFQRLMEGVKSLEEYLILPSFHPLANASPFGFPLTLREGLERRRLIQFLEDAKIETRLVFGGNILRQPGFKGIERRIHGNLDRSDVIMERTFFTGVYPGLSDQAIDYVIEQFHQYFRKHL